MSDSTNINLRRATFSDRAAVAALICDSTNAWYQANRHFEIFRHGPASTTLFFDVYESLDPGCCVIAEDADSGKLLGSCFYHPRETHVSLGIMNVSPSAFGRGVARRLLQFITELADRERKPIRLVSSAMNLDSFSLYTRAGFVPRAAFQDMTIEVLASGFPFRAASSDRLRPATLDDLAGILDVEKRVAHIRREKDWRHFIENREGFWHVSVSTDRQGQIDGVLASIAHPASTMLGPGVAVDDDVAAALIAAELDHRRGLSPVFLILVDRPQLVQQMYAWGARNCEIHFCQVRGEFKGFEGVVMPTFMPETG